MFFKKAYLTVYLALSLPDPYCQGHGLGSSTPEKLMMSLTHTLKKQKVILELHTKSLLPFKCTQPAPQPQHYANPSPPINHPCTHEPHPCTDLARHPRPHFNPTQHIRIRTTLYCCYLVTGHVTKATYS